MISSCSKQKDLRQLSASKSESAIFKKHIIHINTQNQNEINEQTSQSLDKLMCREC